MRGSVNFVIFFVCLLGPAVIADFTQTTITTGPYLTYGNGAVTSGSIQITPSSSQTAGIVLYSAQQTVAYGFTTEFTYSSTNCISSGGDGFNFLISPSTSFATLQKGGSMAAVGQSNIAVVSYDGYNSNLRICSVSSSSTLSWSSNCVATTTLPAIRCNGAHTFKIVFTPSNTWQLWIDGNLQTNGPTTRDLTNTLTLNANGQAYVGFAGATGDSYMKQQITSWTFTSTPTCALNNGGCDVNAACSVDSNSISCVCNGGYTGNGYSCALSPPVSPPVDPPVYVAPPVDPPVYVAPPVDPPVYVAPPVDPPVYVAPPVDPPVYVAPPVDPPVYVAPPVDPPVAAPVYVAPPVDAPVAQPVSAPVYINPPVSVPVAQPVSAPVYVQPPVEVPVAQPVAVPVATPVTTPTAVPVTPPVNPPVSAPVTVNPPTDAPVAMPVIIPILECFDDLQNGTFIAYFGYNNTMGERVSVPVGSMNTFGSPSFLGQPTSFEGGRSDFYPNAAFAYLWSGKTLTWTLTSFRLTLDTTDTSRKCPSFARFTLSFYTERKLNDQEVDAIASGLSSALGISTERVRVLSIKYTPVTSRKRDLSVAELEMEIAAANDTQQNEPSSSEAVQTLIETAKNTTELNQVLDPNGTSDLQFLGIKSAPTGVEQSGSGAPSSDTPTNKTPRGLLMGQLVSGARSETESRFAILSFVVFLTALVIV